MKVLKFMDNIMLTGTVLSVTAMFSTVILQVIARFAFTKAPSWTEEAARFFFIAAIAFAAPLAMKTREYVRVDLFINFFPKKAFQVLEVVLDLFVILFMLPVTFYSVQFIKLGIVQKSPTLEVNMGLPFAGILIACGFITIYGTLNLIEDIKVLTKGVEAS